MIAMGGGSAVTGRIRRITVMAPMLNEAGQIGALVADLAARDYGPLTL